MQNYSFKKLLAVSFTKDQALALSELINQHEFNRKFEDYLDKKFNLINKEITLRFKLLNIKLLLVFIGIALLDLAKLIII